MKRHASSLRPPNEEWEWECPDCPSDGPLEFFGTEELPAYVHQTLASQDLRPRTGHLWLSHGQSNGCGHPIYTLEVWATCLPGPPDFHVFWNDFVLPNTAPSAPSWAADRSAL